MVEKRSQRRVNSRSEKNRDYVFDGNAVRKLDVVPQEKPRQKHVSRTASRNRAKAAKMNPGYVLFLALISTATLLACVRYLQLKSDITTQIKEIATLESKLSRTKADNDALYNTVLASVDLETVKDVAMNRLGMNYPGEDQIYTFDTAGNSYVRQYKNIPNAE